jgi:hypothetical protein
MAGISHAGCDTIHGAESGRWRLALLGLSAKLTPEVGDADRAADIIGRIRDHTKKAPPRKDRFDLNESITEVVGLARSAIAKNGVSVQTRLTEGLAPVFGLNLSQRFGGVRDHRSFIE